MQSCASRPAAPSRWGSDLVISAFEDAVSTLRALPNAGPSTRLAQLRLEMLPDAEPSGNSDAAMRPLRPSAAAITRMDQALAWLAFLPDDRPVLRKLIGLRAQTSASGRPMSWRRIGETLHTDKLACQRWHGQAINILVRELRARRIPLPHPDR